MEDNPWTEEEKQQALTRIANLERLIHEADNVVKKLIVDMAGQKEASDELIRNLHRATS